MNTSEWTAAYLDNIFDIKNISNGALRCLLILQSQAYWNGRKMESANSELATALGCSERTVTRYIMELKKANCLTADRSIINGGIGD